MQIPYSGISKVRDLGDTVVVTKISVPGWGYMATCLDTEGNTFGLWQDDKSDA
jgi:predicted enzyme related to lactoylglutathione lyase